MSHASHVDGSEDVNDFLERIRELGDRRDKEDEERTRKLEEEILQGRKERQARRAERARSISPTKETSSNAATPTTTPLGFDMAANRSTIDPSIDLHPSHLRERAQPQPQTSVSRAISNDTMTSRGLPPSPTKSSLPSWSSPSAAILPARAGTLSWQQRPSSRSSNGIRSRPTSVVADTDPTPSEVTSESPSATEFEPSRSQIAHSLQSKDPSWFRQTSDRGMGSAAYRRNAEDTTSDHSSVGGSMRLPGMSRASTNEPEKVFIPGVGNDISTSLSRASSVQGSDASSNQYSSQSSVVNAGGLGPLMPLSNAQRFEPRVSESAPAYESTTSDRVAMSPSQGRLSPERPSSPTKGMGGFVQSAMLKRSDSVNKRWSTQAPVGLSRGNSIASNHSGFGVSMNTPRGSASPPRDTRPLSMGRESSPLSSSRPGSSHSGVTVVANTKGNERPGTSGTMSSRADSVASVGFVKPPLPLSLSRSSHTPETNSPKSPDKDESLPVSPSKTMDPKRWSPTKSSWLESAINKPPESPKPKSQPPQQPAWMSELNKSKQQQGAVEPPKPSPFKEVSTGGLLRSPPMGGSTKPLTIGGLPEGFSSGSVKKSDAGSPTRPNAATPPIESAEKKLIDRTPDKQTFKTEQTRDQSETPPKDTSRLDRQTAESTPFASVFTPRQDRSSPTPELKRKPETPPKMDFRANLKTRQPPKGDSSNQESEFKNALGKLKRTQTKNYIAPDELKDNILRGKTGLNTTGGPKKTQRVDEFKDSLLKQKEAMKTGGGNLRRQATGDSDGSGKEKTPPTVPEALAKRQNLSRSNSNLSNEGSTKFLSPSKSEVLPEATVEEAFDSSPSQKVDSKIGPKPTVAPKVSPKSSAPASERRPFQTTTALKGTLDSPMPALENSLSRKAETGLVMQTLPSKDEPVVSIESFKPKSNPVELSGLSTQVTATPRDPAMSAKLAGRINPALAGKLGGILSRGGAPPSSESNLSDPAPMRTIPPSQKSSQADEPGSGSSLTHMTKGRARGPKRRLPATKPSDTAMAKDARSAVVETKRPETVTTTPFDPIADRSPPKTLPSRPLPPPTNQKDDKFDRYPLKTSTPRPLPDIQNTEDSQFADLYPPKNPLVKKRSVFDLDSKPSGGMNIQSDKSKPPVSTKSPMLQRVISPPTRSTASPTQGTSDNDSSPELSKTSSATSYVSRSGPIQPQVSQPAIHEEGDLGAGDSTHSFSTAWSRLGRTATPDAAKQESVPQQSRATAEDVSADKDDMVGLGLRSVSVNARGKEPAARSLPTPPTKQPTSPPIPKKSSTISMNSPHNDQQVSPPLTKKSANTTIPKITHRIKPSITSPIPRTSDAQRVIQDFFDITPSAKQKIAFDTQAILSSKWDVVPKISTIRMSIWEINGDGKKQDMPPHQEYILFEECMYLIVHHFSMPNSTKVNEVTLWCGDGVGEAAIEDAQLFCRKIARENSTKLTVVKQGKETANFIQALGGILITRRRRANSMYMLCCRQHLGQIVFDEVDLTPAKLCSAFPYIISAKFGKLFLWKGKGSTADELGCARLIGMDLGLTGEFEEVSEESEPLSFFEAFPNNHEQSVPKSSQNWAQRPKHAKYACRLFHISHEPRQMSSLSTAANFFSRRGSPQLELSAMIKEIDPFCQADLDPGHIYMLDAFFEIYVLVGTSCSSKSAEFVTAVLLAQEYGILTASIQDRPFIPASSVVIGGLPKDGTAVFRKWKEQSKQHALTVLELNSAVEAMMKE